MIHLATGRDKKLTEQFIKDKNIADITDVLSMTVPGESAKVSDKIVPGFTDTSITNPSQGCWRRPGWCWSRRRAGWTGRGASGARRRSRPCAPAEHIYFGIIVIVPNSGGGN